MQFLLVLAACQGEPTPIPTPFVEPTPTERPWVDTGIYRPNDTAEVELLDDVPSDVLSIEHAGYWDRSGSPYDALVGRLEVRERVNGYQPDTSDTGDILPCDVAWFLTGTPDESVMTCEGCGPIWTLTFTQDPASVGQFSACRDPDLPGDGDVWRMAFHPEDETIYFNFFGTGVWLPWWPARPTGDRVDFGWVGTLAIDLGEEE